MLNTHNTLNQKHPFSFRNRVYRVAWNVFYLLFFRYSPRPLHSWRSLILKLFGAKVGKNVHIYPKVKIWAPCNLIVQDEVGVGDGAILYSQATIILQYRSIISQGVHLCTGTHDYTKKEHPLIAYTITIGAMAWIAAEAFVHPGVTIGDGAVIGARSVVLKDMPEWMVCSGNPCRPIKKRELK